MQDSERLVAQSTTRRRRVQLRPTKLPYPELYSLEGATSFVVNAIKYEAFENELHLPDFLLSPQSTLAFQAGDSLDMATLLVSILAGAGFDAYVVVGYAPPEVVRNDQSAAVCPLLEAEAAAVEATAAAERDAPAAASTGANAAASKYTCAPESCLRTGKRSGGHHCRSSADILSWRLQDQAGARARV